jgi:hypothetical protein
VVFVYFLPGALYRDGPWIAARIKAQAGTIYINNTSNSIVPKV